MYIRDRNTHHEDIRIIKHHYFHVNNVTRTTLFNRFTAAIAQAELLRNDIIYKLCKFHK